MITQIIYEICLRFPSPVTAGPRAAHCADAYVPGKFTLRLQIKLYRQ